MWQVVSDIVTPPKALLVYYDDLSCIWFTNPRAT
jgi:hypothetical protein